MGAESTVLKKQALNHICKILGLGASLIQDRKWKFRIGVADFMTLDIPLQRYDSVVEESPAAQSSKRKSTVLWMSIAFGVALGLAAAVLAIDGTDHKGLVMGLRLTARWSFLLFWVAYSGGAMAALFGPAFERLARRGREFGLAIWLFQISSRPPLAGKLFAFFVIGIFWTYLLAIFSFGGLAKTLGSRCWRILRIVGLNYILFAFAFDFVPPV